VFYYILLSQQQQNKYAAAWPETRPGHWVQENILSAAFQQKLYTFLFIPVLCIFGNNNRFSLTPVVGYFK